MTETNGNNSILMRQSAGKEPKPYNLGMVLPQRLRPLLIPDKRMETGMGLRRLIISSDSLRYSLAPYVNKGIKRLMVTRVIYIHPSQSLPKLK